MSAIESCRTAALGGHVARCEDCTYTTIAYNSCRNRHCPKCQGAAAKQWLAERQADLLAVPYYHIVFTMPAAIADIAYQNKAVVYDLLFKASAETMLTIASDPKHLGARIGITSVLHTWGSTLTHHPHVHMIVPGGGIALDGSRWVSCRSRFFLPWRVLAKLFRRLMLESSSLHMPPVNCSSSASIVIRQARCLHRLPDAAAQDQMVRLRQTALRRTRGGIGLSVPLHPSRRHRQQPADRVRQKHCQLQIQGLSARRPRSLQGDDARNRRVHPPLPHPRLAQGLG